MSTCCLENFEQVCQLQVVNNKLVTVDLVQLLLLCVMGKDITILSLQFSLCFVHQVLTNIFFALIKNCLR